jgi:hypothetical protein
MKRKQRAEVKKSKYVRRKKKQQKKKSPWIFPLVVLLLFSGTLIISYALFKRVFVFDSSFIDSIEARRSGQEGKDKQEDVRRLYRVNGDTPGKWYSLQDRKDTAIVSAENVIRKYLQTFETNLLDLYIDRRGIIYVDIGKEIRKNFMGDASEEYGLIAGLCESIRSRIPNFTALKILIDGEEAESFGGHIDISRPMRGDITDIADRT